MKDLIREEMDEMQQKPVKANKKKNLGKPKNSSPKLNLKQEEIEKVLA